MIFKYYGLSGKWQRHLESKSHVAIENVMVHFNIHFGVRFHFTIDYVDIICYIFNVVRFFLKLCFLQLVCTWVTMQWVSKFNCDSS